MQLEYSLTSQDFIDFNNHYLARSSVARRNRQCFVLLPALLGFYFAAVIDSSPSTKALLFALPFGWLCVAVPMWKSHIKYHVNKAIAKGRDTDFFGEHTFVIGPEGFVTTGADSRIEMKWKTVKEVVVGANGVYVSVRKGAAYIIPNTAFASDTQRHAFLEAVLRYREQAAGIEAL